MELVVKRLGSEKYICETYGVTDAKAWAKEQVSLMNQAEKEEALPVTMDFFPSNARVTSSGFPHTIFIISSSASDSCCTMFLSSLMYDAGRRGI